MHQLPCRAIRIAQLLRPEGGTQEPLGCGTPPPRLASRSSAHVRTGVTSYSRFKMFLLSSSSTAGLWLSRLRKNTRITFCTMVAACEFPWGQSGRRWLVHPSRSLPKSCRRRRGPLVAASSRQVQADPPHGREVPAVKGLQGERTRPLSKGVSSCPGLRPAWRVRGSQGPAFDQRWDPLRKGCLRGREGRPGSGFWIWSCGPPGSGTPGLALLREAPAAQPAPA